MYNNILNFLDFILVYDSLIRIRQLISHINSKNFNENNIQIT